MKGLLRHACTWRQLPLLPFVRGARGCSTLLGDAKGKLPEEAKPIPVGIFIDLDNVRPEKFGRADARAFVESLRVFGNTAGKLSTISAFANLATRRHIGQAERERRETMLDEAEWNQTSFHTGYDEGEVLRCGICGSKMSVNKKDRARGVTPEDKLKKHMRMLHNREQAKRIRKSQNGQMGNKDREKMQKFNSARVGLGSPLCIGGRGRQNDLFQVLREQGVHCRHADNVDKALERVAIQWIRGLPPASQRASSIATAVAETRACLVVVSEDADFAPLLSTAKKVQILAVSATLKSTRQTRKLCVAADLVLSLHDSSDGQEHQRPLESEVERDGAPQEYVQRVMGNLLVSSRTLVGHRSVTRFKIEDPPETQEEKCCGRGARVEEDGGEEE